jgi:hypothetical protein
MILEAARRTRDHLDDFARGPTIFPDDFRLVAHDIGALDRFIINLEAIHAREMP